MIGIQGRRALFVRSLETSGVRVKLFIDACFWAFAIVGAVLIEWYPLVPTAVLGEVFAFAALGVIAHVVIGWAVGVYRGLWRYGSFDEAGALALAASGTILSLFFYLRVSNPLGLRSGVAFIAGTTALLFMVTARYVWRFSIERMMQPSAEESTRLVVFGAGQGGAQIVATMLHDPNSAYTPVALLDDDPGKQRLRLMGVPVVGTRANLAHAVHRHRAEAVLVAIPSADAHLITEIGVLAAEAKVPVRVVPSVAELMASGRSVTDIREPTEADLLGRGEIRVNLAETAGYLSNKRILVTGAGGSIGSELCRQIARLGPSKLLIADRDESALLAVQISVDGRGEADWLQTVLVDLRDSDAVWSMLKEARPDVVFHAAALKHVPMLEQHPSEAVKVNVFGTLTLLEAAAKVGVQCFVNISSDKAADPANVLGLTKRLAERLTAWYGTRNGGLFLSVRFGNVLGSRGSVLETFRTQIASGGPLTLTHPDATRFFMTIEEAVQLVIQAGAVGRSGEVLVLDMGAPVRIEDVAMRLASQTSAHVEIVYTGLRPGEKLHEVLFGRDEFGQVGRHPLISHVEVPPLAPERLGALDPTDVSARLVARLRAATTLNGDSAESKAEPVPLRRVAN